MEGISKKRLKAILHNQILTPKTQSFVQYLIEEECSELQEPWITLDENTPKDRLLLVWSEIDGFNVAYWSTSVWVERNGSWIALENRSDTIILRPTHWQELPNPPEVTTIHKPEPPR